MTGPDLHPDGGSATTHLLLGAALFAAHKHRAQRRKDVDASPFINHPLAVAEVLSRHGVEDPLVLQAALLHDTVEDTETTEEELARHFGPTVAAVVMEVTDDKSLPRDRRKELQVSHAPHLSEAARLVKIGDKICNVLDVGSNPPAGWGTERRRAYLDWTERVVEGCRGLNPPLEAHYDEVLRRARAFLDDDGGEAP